MPTYITLWFYRLSVTNRVNSEGIAEGGSVIFLIQNEVDWRECYGYSRDNAGLGQKVSLYRLRYSFQEKFGRCRCWIDELWRRGQNNWRFKCRHKLWVYPLKLLNYLLLNMGAGLAKMAWASLVFLNRLRFSSTFSASVTLRIHCTFRVLANLS